MRGEINNNIKSIRELKDYTQQYMAIMLGITQAAYSKMEKGVNRISFEKLEEIAAVFEMNLNDIIQFDSSLYFRADLPKESFSTQQCGTSAIEKLYRDKISLLEKLLNLKDSELQQYITKFGLL